jgi:putative mRNA 3-end processing factor
MKLVFHGGAREVGRSCIEVATATKRLLLDCGLKIASHDSEYPVNLPIVNDIHAVFISHAHLDHTGGLPQMDHKGMDCPIFMTKTTRELTRLILKDAFKVGKITHQHLGYDEPDIRKVLSCIRKVVVDTKGGFDGISFEFFDAGHIPGSSSIFMDVEGTTLLYTGDINNSETLLLHAAETDFPEIDIMVCESTYGAKDHPLRVKEEQRFIDAIKSTLANKGSAIIPVFAIGRAQEILLMLSKYKFGCNVYFDGMCIEATDIILSDPEDIVDSEALSAVMKRVRLVHKEPDRLVAINKPSIIVTTSGMLTGGPVLAYLRYLYNKPNSSVLITGYQAEDTNGRMLLERREVYIDGMKKKVQCRVEQFDFSAHSGMSQLKAMVRKLKPKKVFFVHGEVQSALAMQEWASALGMEAYAPQLGDTITL